MPVNLFFLPPEPASCTLSAKIGVSADAAKLNTEQIKSCVLYAPKPYYPSRAAREYKTGAGTFLLKENPK